MEPVVPPEPVFYNDNCAYAVDWLRNLTSAGHLPTGVVDDRDIERITPDAVKGFKECHFFAGIGGWPLALRLAGWPLGRLVWTGSCPCQPFSTAGKRKGTTDSRHLWPEFLRLIAECRPPTVFGEQVASKLGRKWLARVRFDLEALGYGVGAADLCGPCVGAPHIRQRLYWVADANVHGHEWGVGTWQECQQKEEGMQSGGQAAQCDGTGRVGNPRGALRPGRGLRPLAETPATGQAQEPESRGAAPAPGNNGQTGGWDVYDLVYCRDDKVRRVEPGLQCLVDGASFRLADGRSRQDVSCNNLLRGIGNAIIPQVAAMFVMAYLGQ